MVVLLSTRDVTKVKPIHWILQHVNKVADMLQNSEEIFLNTT